jgi:hypothetical protein
MRPLGFEVEASKQFWLTHTYTSKAKTWAIHSQLDLEATIKSYEDSQITFNFHEIWR